LPSEEEFWNWNNNSSIMKYILFILLLILSFTTNAQYGIHREYDFGNYKDTVLRKDGTDSLFRLIDGEYVFSGMIKTKLYLGTESINGLSALLNSKQTTLVSGVNIKTINGSSVLGVGDLTLSAGNAAWGSITGSLANQTDLNTALNGKASASHNHAISDVTNLQSSLDAKQSTLVSGTNIKTINGSSVLGNGDLTVSGAPVFYYGSDAGNNDSYAVTISGITSYTPGMIITFRANTANTTGCTLNVNGLGAIAIVKRNNTTPASNDIIAGMICMVVYNGNNQFTIVNPIVN
jgi:hypothetical protein